MGYFWCRLGLSLADCWDHQGHILELFGLLEPYGHLNQAREAVVPLCLIVTELGWVDVLRLANGSERALYTRNATPYISL